MSRRPLFEVAPSQPAPLAAVLQVAVERPTSSAAWPPPVAATPRPAVAPAAAAPAPAPAAPVAPPAYDPAELERRVAAARADLERASAAKLQEQLAANQAQLAEGLARLDRAAQVAGRPSAAEVVELALAAAQELAGRALELDRGALLATVREALDVVQDDGATATVRVSIADAAWLRANQPDGFARVKLVEDARLASGGVVVETARTVIDASLEARIEAVRQAFRAALEESP